MYRRFFFKLLNLHWQQQSYALRSADESKLVSYCTQLSRDRKGPGFKSRRLPKENYSHDCGCLCK